MLDVALIYEEAFNRLAYMDKNYVFNPSKEEWKLARIIRDCLKIFSDASVHLVVQGIPLPMCSFRIFVRLNFNCVNGKIVRKCCFVLWQVL